MSDTFVIEGYTVTVETYDAPENPFEAFDCEPPLLVYSEILTKYGNVPDIGDLVGMIPDEVFARGNRVKLIKENMNCSLYDFALNKRHYGESFRDAFARECSEQCPEPGFRGWVSSIAHCEMLEFLCGLAGVPCFHKQSNGYSQGHSALVMAFATKEWAEMVGAPAESHVAQCEGACDLYGYWAWGDVYGISSIEDPDGNEIPDGSVWGFYGSDHEKSGLVDSAKNSIGCHIERVKREAEELAAYEKKESAEAHYWACCDIVTI